MQDCEMREFFEFSAKLKISVQCRQLKVVAFAI